MEHSAGILMVYKNKVLLCHPTNGPWNYCMPPKGHIEKGESKKEAAVRETFEETGLLIEKKKLGNSFLVRYTNKNGTKCQKEVTIFVCEIESLGEIGLSSEQVPTEMLELEENDSARFYDLEEVESYCFWRYKEKVKEILGKMK